MAFVIPELTEAQVTLSMLYSIVTFFPGRGGDKPAVIIVLSPFVTFIVGDESVQVIDVEALTVVFVHPRIGRPDT